MKRIVLILLLGIATGKMYAQKDKEAVTGIFFHLYTDSLKKGTHNYINVDGKLADGKWMPLTEKEIIFSASNCNFSGNELIIPPDFKEEKITVKAVLRRDASVWIEKTIWVKKKPDPDRLPTK